MLVNALRPNNDAKSVLYICDKQCAHASRIPWDYWRDFSEKLDTLFNIYNHCVQHLTLGFMPHPWPGASVRVTVMMSLSAVI